MVKNLLFSVNSAIGTPLRLYRYKKKYYFSSYICTYSSVVNQLVWWIKTRYLDSNCAHSKVIIEKYIFFQLKIKENYKLTYN